MKVRSKRRILIILFAAVLCLGTCIAAYAAGNFVITDYDIRMIVNEDDTYEITETIDVAFTMPSHGIYRQIPERTRLERDGQVSQYKAGISNFSVLTGQPFSTEHEDGNVCFRIGDPDNYADEFTTYQLSYIYDTGGDHYRGGDEVFYNMIGTSWEAQSIDHVSFEIVFPSDIDMTKVGIRTGDNINIPFESPDGHTIKGETDANVLGGLTVRAVLPEDYFTREARNTFQPLFIVAGVLALLSLLGVGLWRKYGIDPVYPVTLEFNPPEGISAPEAAYLLKGELEGADVISILLTLADKGYLVIHEYEDKWKTKYSIEKIRDYDGTDQEERMFMYGLFRSGNYVYVDDLRNVFHSTVSSIQKSIENKYKGRLYDQTAAGKARIMYVASGIGLLAMFICAMHDGAVLQGFDDLTSLVLPGALSGLGLMSIAKDVRNHSARIRSYVIACAAFLAGAVICLSFCGLTPVQMLAYFLGVSCCMLLAVLAGLCEKRTDFYARLYARLKGYTEFLKTAEKDQMETLACSDPGYFYRNLAYAFALGITTIYAGRFASLAYGPPSWYDSYNNYGMFGSDSMFSSINNMAKSVSKDLSYNSSDSDGSGGGSFSGGGGGGGGGGGSW